MDAGGAIVVRGPRIGERAARGQIEDAHFIAAASPDRIIALLDEIAALRAERAWQPIETAPRDCCVIGWADEWEASSAGVLRCKLTHAEAQIEAAERALEDVAPGLLAEHAPVFGAILELGERLRAAEARSAWQPIETADEGPFDEPQLVCMPSGRYAVARYDGRRWWHEDGRPIATPSARMPLPAPPASEVPRG